MNMMLPETSYTLSTLKYSVHLGKAEISDN